MTGICGPLTFECYKHLQHMMYPPPPSLSTFLLCSFGLNISWSSWAIFRFVGPMNCLKGGYVGVPHLLRNLWEISVVLSGTQWTYRSPPHAPFFPINILQFSHLHYQELSRKCNEFVEIYCKTFSVNTLYQCPSSVKTVINCRQHN